MSQTIGHHVVTYLDVQKNQKIIDLILGANEVLRAMGFTEHGLRHVTTVAERTGHLLESIRSTPREVELGKISGFMHDIGNVINRINHPLTGANLSYVLLSEMGMPTPEIAKVMSAIGNHEELAGVPVSDISAAVILADKSDVHYSRVQNPIIETFDIHDRVNYAVQRNQLIVKQEERQIFLEIETDSYHASILEYFEIFLSRMVMCREAARVLGYKFTLDINGTELE